MGMGEEERRASRPVPQVTDSLLGDSHLSDPQVEDPREKYSVMIPWMMGVAEETEEGWWERRRRNPKRLGEISQAAFLLKAQRLGLGLAVPWGDSEKWDFVVWARGGRLLRVQVKATGRCNRGGYDVQPVYSTRDEGKKAYTAEEIDVLAAHVVIEGKTTSRSKSESRAAGEGARSTQADVWYLIPVEAFQGVKSLRFFPEVKGRDPRWERYREAWEWVGLER